jgi:hypothetical protein
LTGGQGLALTHVFVGDHGHLSVLVGPDLGVALKVVIRHVNKRHHSMAG